MALLVHWVQPADAQWMLGGIAQLGERLHGMQEVSGSIPLTSTKIFRGLVAEFNVGL